MTYTLSGTSALGSQYTAGANMRVFTSSGDVVEASAVSVGGQRFENGVYFNFTKDIPTKLSVQFKMPAAASLRALEIYKARFDNVAVRATASVPAPTVMTPAPNAGVPTGFQMTLSNCKIASGTYTCTATLTPTR